MATIDEIHEIYQSKVENPFDRLWHWADADDRQTSHRRFAALCDWAQHKRDEDRDGDTVAQWENRRQVYCHRAHQLAQRLHDDGHGLGNMKVTVAASSPHWGGGNDVMGQFVEPFMTKRGLPIGSGKRTPAENKAAGGSSTSDHLTTHTMAMARDFPTFSGEDDARALAKEIGFDSWQPNEFTTFSRETDGHTFRWQILWGAAIHHGDHVHVGIGDIS
jgi:hypothetical protein